MGKPSVPRAQKENIGNLATELARELITDLEAKLKSEPRIFPSGIELIKLTLKAGSNYEFSVVIAGKDAPKVEGLNSKKSDIIE
jgi:hypothetical protein